MNTIFLLVFGLLCIGGALVFLRASLDYLSNPDRGVGERLLVIVLGGILTLAFGIVGIGMIVGAVSD